ncbi:MAG: glycosyltransferase family 39 protein [Bryobacteraceae bacterium]|jgi:hypothetical protein
MNVPSLWLSARLRRATALWLVPLAILALNLAIAGRLFRLEYSANFGSNEGQFIAIARGVAVHLGDLKWWPEWSCGLPFQNTYLPLSNVAAGLLSRATGHSPALAFHQVAAAFFCLGPVFLYAMAWVMTRKPGASFLAAAVYSVFSPCALIPAFRVDLGGLWNLRRLQIIAFYGEGPHIAMLAFLPLAILFLYLAMERGKLRHSVWAGIFMGATILSNAFGAVILAGAAAALLATAPAKRFRRNLFAMAAIAALTYCWISPALPPSVIAAIRMNSPTVDGDYRFTIRSLAGVAILAGGFAAAWIATLRWRAHLRFFLLFAWLMTGIVALGVMAHIYVVPQPHRYQIAMDMSLCLLAAFGGAQVCERLSPRTLTWVTLALAVALAVQGRHAIRYGRGHIWAGDATQTAMYRVTRWLDGHLHGERVMVGGSYSFYADDFSDLPQLHGGQDPMLPNFMLRIATFTIYSGMNAGARDGEIAALWLRALGARAVSVPGPHSEETYKPFANPNKFEGLLPALWREGDDTIYGVPARSGSLAHVMAPGDLVRDPPVNGLDTAELERYDAALESPAYPEAAWRWTSRHSAVIDAPIAPGQVVSVQVTYTPGWRAWAGGAEQEISKDGLGFLTVKPACQGPCQIALSFDGGREWRVTCLLSLAAMLAVLGLAGAAFWRRMTLPKPGDLDGNRRQIQP